MPATPKIGWAQAGLPQKSWKPKVLKLSGRFRLPGYTQEKQVCTRVGGAIRGAWIATEHSEMFIAALHSTAL